MTPKAAVRGIDAQIRADGDAEFVVKGLGNEDGHPHPRDRDLGTVPLRPMV
jgi:hypothetical protein